MIMPRSKGSTRIHKENLDAEVGNLARMRWTARRIIGYIKLKYGIELSLKEIYHFRQRYIRPDEIMPPQVVREELEKRSVLTDPFSARAELIHTKISIKSIKATVCLKLRSFTAIIGLLSIR